MFSSIIKKEFNLKELNTSIKDDTLGKMLGLEFNPDGSLSTAKDVGNTPVFKRLNRKQRRKNGVYSHKFQKTLKRV